MAKNIVCNISIALWQFSSDNTIQSNVATYIYSNYIMKIKVYNKEEQLAVVDLLIGDFNFPFYLSAFTSL